METAHWPGGRREGPAGSPLLAPARCRPAGRVDGQAGRQDAEAWPSHPGSQARRLHPRTPCCSASSEHQARVLCSWLTLKVLRKLKGTAQHPHGLGSGAPTSQREPPTPAIGPCHVSPAPNQGPWPGQGAPSSAAPDCAAQPPRLRTTHSSNKNAPRMFRASCFSRGAGFTLP